MQAARCRVLFSDEKLKFHRAATPAPARAKLAKGYFRLAACIAFDCAAPEKRRQARRMCVDGVVESAPPQRQDTLTLHADRVTSGDCAGAGTLPPDFCERA